jgi:hypothetical protein
MKDLKKEIMKKTNGQWPRPVVPVNFNHCYSNGVLDEDQIIQYLGKERPDILNSSLIGVPNTNFSLSPVTVQKFRTQVKVIVVDLLNKTLRTATFSLDYLLNVKGWAKTLTDA